MKSVMLNCNVKAIGDESDRVLRFIATSEAKDRERDIIDASGWRIENYMKNPVVLFGHDYYSPPIGRAVDVKVEDATKIMFADVKFPSIAEMSTGQPSDHALFVDTIFNLAKNGYLNAMSVGFRALQYNQMEDYGVHYLEQELLELSIVPVPANPEALQQARSAGVISEKAFSASKTFFDADLKKCAKCETEAKAEDPEDVADQSGEMPSETDEKSAVEKVGRRISAATLTKLTNAIEAAKTALDELESLIQDEPSDEDSALIDNKKDAESTNADNDSDKQEQDVACEVKIDIEKLKKIIDKG